MLLCSKAWSVLQVGPPEYVEGKPQQYGSSSSNHHDSFLSDLGNSKAPNPFSTERGAGASPALAARWSLSPVPACPVLFIFWTGEQLGFSLDFHSLMRTLVQSRTWVTLSRSPLFSFQPLILQIHQGEKSWAATYAISAREPCRSKKDFITKTGFQVLDASLEGLQLTKGCTFFIPFTYGILFWIRLLCFITWECRLFLVETFCLSSHLQFSPIKDFYFLTSVTKEIIPWTF